MAAFLMGMLIMYHETFQDKSQRPYLYVAAISLMGLQVAESMDKVVTFFGSVWAAYETRQKQHREHPLHAEQENGTEQKENP
jgi:hypothetical protein